MELAVDEHVVTQVTLGDEAEVPVERDGPVIIGANGEFDAAHAT